VAPVDRPCKILSSGERHALSRPSPPSLPLSPTRCAARRDPRHLDAGTREPPAPAQELNLYTYREPGLIKPLTDEFTKETGIKVNTLFAASGLEERLQAEGANSPADVLLTVDIGRLQQAKDFGVTQAVKSDALEKAIPAAYRDPEGRWFGVSLRGRVVYASKERVKQQAITYDELADAAWKGKLCTRSGQHLYNISIIAAAVAHMGDAKAEDWLKGLKASLAKKPSGGDRDVIKDIAAGGCDIGLGNTYYVALRGSPHAAATGQGFIRSRTMIRLHTIAAACGAIRLRAPSAATLVLSESRVASVPPLLCAAQKRP
jgi:hypothetical protein